MERLRILTVVSIGLLFIISTINAQCYGSADGNCLKRKDFQYQLQGVRIDPFPLQRSGEVRRSPLNQNQEVHRTQEQESNFDSEVTGDTNLHSGHAGVFRPYAYAAPTIRDVRWPHARVHAVTTNVNPQISKATENVDPTVTPTDIKSEPTAKILDSLMSEMGAKLNVDDGPEIKLKSLASSEDSEEFNTQDIVNDMMRANVTGCTNEKEEKSEKREKLEFEPKNDEIKDKKTSTTIKSPLEKIKEELVLMNKVVSPPAPPFPPAVKPPPPPPPQAPKASMPKAIVTPQNKVTTKEDAEMKSLENEKGKNSSQSSSSSGDADDKDEKTTEKLKKVTGEEKEKKNSETMEKEEKETKEDKEKEEVAKETPSTDEQSITEKPKTHHKIKLVEVSEEDNGEAETPKSTTEESEKKETEGKSKKSEKESNGAKKKARRVINTTDSKDGEDWDYTDGVDKVERESDQVEGDVNTEGKQDNKKKDKNSKKARKHKKTDETEESDENSDKEKNTDEDEKTRDNGDAKHNGNDDENTEKMKKKPGKKPHGRRLKVEKSGNDDDNEEATVHDDEQGTVEESKRKPKGRRIKVEKADTDDDNEDATVQEGVQGTVEESTRKPKGRRIKVEKADNDDDNEEATVHEGEQGTVEESTLKPKGRRVKIEMKNNDNEEDEEPLKKNQKKPQNRRTKVRKGDQKAELEGQNAEETPKKSGTASDDEIVEITEEGARRLNKKKKEPEAEEAEGGEEGEEEREQGEEEGAENETEESAPATRSPTAKKRKQHRKSEADEHEELEEFLESRGNKGKHKTRKQKTQNKKASEAEDIRSNPDVRAKLRDAPNVKYYYPPKVNLPLPSCFYNPTGYACCNVKLNNLIEETFATVKAMKTVNSCNINLMAKKLQEASQNEFEHPFETIVSLADFAQNVHFAGDLVCKVEIDGKFMLTYATPYHADMALNGTGGIGNYPGKRIKQPLNIHSLRI